MKNFDFHSLIRGYRALCLLFVLFVSSPLDVKPAVCAEPPNVLLICIDDLRPELNCYGVDYIQSPNIDRLANESGMFVRHYVQAPTCGASRYAMLTGRYGGDSNEALFQRAARITAGKKETPSMPEWFRQQGYRTVSVGKVSHHPGGLGGADWNDEAIVEMPQAWDEQICPSGDWQHPRGFMHGLAHGEIRTQANEMDLFQSTAGSDDIYPDGLTTNEALRQLGNLTTDTQQPFFLAVGILRPHLPFGAPAKYMLPYRDVTLPPIAHPEKPSGRTTWHHSGEFMKYQRWGHDPNLDTQFAGEVRRHYAACVTYADAQVGRILEQLEAVGAKDNTIVVLWGDHGWHLGEHAIWGKHALFEESLRSPLLIHVPGSPPDSVKSFDTIVESVDIFPTLCELAGLVMPGFVQGESLAGILRGGPATEQTAISYFKQARSLRTDRYRFIVHRDGHRELYDHAQQPGETENIAQESSELCDELQRSLDERCPDTKR
ncbi:MAG: sulfatase [Planctomycetales bacterium]|nr:sulfatase [Planctomycetales bacterium]